MKLDPERNSTVIDWSQIPESHPVRKLFEKLADRALTQTSLPDRDVHRYVSSLLLQFIHADSLYQLKSEDGTRVQYLVDMLQLAKGASRSGKRELYKYIGDYTLFILGMFPESLSHGRRMIPHSYYVDTGRMSYRAASDLSRNSASIMLFRKMADLYNPCVKSINWVRKYTHDPFYQYMFRQFGIT